jgi:hypothetical protein
MARKITIRTRYRTASDGGGRILATGAGRRRIVRYSHASTIDERRQDAAQTLAVAILGSVRMLAAPLQWQADGSALHTFYVGEVRGIGARTERQAHHLLTNHGHGSHSDRLTRENCGACVLNGYRPRGESRTAPPNYAGWARIYTQARRPVPAQWRRAFLADELGEVGDQGRPTPYALALLDDIATYGLPWDGAR